MKIAMWEHDLSENHLKWASQIGVDGIDIHNPLNIPGVKEQGYPDLNKLLALRNRLRRIGLKIFRVSLPFVYKFFLRGEEGGEEEVNNMCRTIECLGKASIPIGRPRFLGTPPIMTTHMAEHRGGYTQRAYNPKLIEEQLKERKIERIWYPKEHWTRCLEIYKRIVPVAEDYEVKLALHPSDPPLPEAPFSSLGLRRVLDAVPSPNNGLLYCVGTRYEAGGTNLVLDEIRYFGRREKIFEVHFRNVRGNLATSCGFEEVALDDGDMNMFTIIKALQKVGFEGPLNPDHMPHLIDDTPERRMAWSYAVGYVKALLSALE
jgi:mannonate dehydratase